MINNERIDYEAIGVSNKIDLSKLDEEDLLILRSQIDDLLPVKRLADVNLEEELMLQLRTAQALQSRVIKDDLTPANQKAQVIGSVASTIQNLVKMQLEYYTPERLKHIESALIATLNEWPAEMTQKFFEQYEKILERK